jgi:hypothetical protein
MKIKPEEGLQIAVADFARIHKIPFCHIANERKCSYIYGQLLKRMGVKPGFSDCFFPRGNNIFKGLFIELKIKPNKPTPNQLLFLEEMIQEGYAGHIAYSIDEAMTIIKAFYSL